MNIFKSYKRSRFFLYVNITGLAIGLAVAIMLLLFIVNELSFDRHFANHERIVRLLTVIEHDGNRSYTPIGLRRAYTEIPQQVPGIEAATQIYDLGRIEFMIGENLENRFQDVRALSVDTDFFRVFQMRFLAGTPETALCAPNSLVLTRRSAEMMFGSVEAAMGQSIADGFKIVTGIVEELPTNTHFHFDMLSSTQAEEWLNQSSGLELHTYFLLQEGVSIDAVRANIENAYTAILQPWSEAVGASAHGKTELLRHVYLSPNVTGGLGAVGNRRFIWILSGLALLVLALAIANFVNLFLTQGETRLKEIAIRKANGAQVSDIIRLFFKEVATVVLLAFVIGFLLAVYCVPFFSELIDRNIDLVQLLNPAFLVSVLLLYGVTVLLSASYPAFYVSRFSPLAILSKQIRFSKRRLTAVTIVFQSIISIVLLSVILTLFKQTAHMQNLPLGFNPENVMSVRGHYGTRFQFEDIRQELLRLPEVRAVAGSDHQFGGGWSGQVIALWGEERQNRPINEYRLMQGMPELMELELVEGRFWREDDPRDANYLILNEAAVRMLGVESPLEQVFMYWREARVIGVVRDFYYDNPALSIQPIALSRVFRGEIVNIRFAENVDRVRAREITLEVLQRFDPYFVINPVWSVDIVQSRFESIRMMTRIVFFGALFAIFVAMLGLLAIHLHSAVRRTKEIGVRKVYGASKMSVFTLLSLDILKWVAFSSVIAIPVAYFVVAEMLSNYYNHVTPSWVVFALPVLIQCVIAILTTSGVTLKAMGQNPVRSLKTE